MTTAVSERPDLASHEKAVRAAFPEVIGELQQILGAQLVAYLGSVSETRAVREWAEGERSPKDSKVVSRLRLALQIALSLNDVDGPEITQAWFQGLNPILGDRSPASIIREGDPNEVGPAIIAAEREFLFSG